MKRWRCDWCRIIVERQERPERCPTCGWPLMAQVIGGRERECSSTTEDDE